MQQLDHARDRCNVSCSSMSRGSLGSVRRNAGVCAQPRRLLDVLVNSAWTDEVKAPMSAMVPLGRIGQPEEVIGAALYLVSEASQFTNGAMIKVDGGAAFGG